MSILDNFCRIFEFKIKDALSVIFWNRFIFLRVILFKVYYQPNKFTIYQYGAISIYLSKNSQNLIIQILIFKLRGVVHLKYCRKAGKICRVCYIVFYVQKTYVFHSPFKTYFEVLLVLFLKEYLIMKKMTFFNFGCHLQINYYS